MYLFRSQDGLVGQHDQASMTREVRGTLRPWPGQMARHVWRAASPSACWPCRHARSSLAAAAFWLPAARPPGDDTSQASPSTRPSAQSHQRRLVHSITV